MIMDGVRDAEKVADLLQTVIDGACVVMVYLRRLYEAEIIVVGATDGTETFASSGLFPGGVYGLTLPKDSVVATQATHAAVYKMTADGTYAQLFGSLSEERHRWTEAQVCAFVRAHQGKLRTEGYATFFEL